MVCLPAAASAKELARASPPETIAWPQRVAPPTELESGRASPPETIVWSPRVAPSSKAQVAAMPDHPAHASAEAVPGAAAKRTAPAQIGAAETLSARASSPEPIVWPPRAVSSPRAQAAEMRDHQAHASAEAVPGQAEETPACPFQAAAQARLVLPVPSARLAGAVEAAVRDVAVEAVQPQAAAHAEAAAQDAAAAGVAVAGPHAVAAAVAAPQASAAAAVVAAAQRDAVGVPVRPRAALAAQPAARASPLACRRDQALPWPVPLPAARFARAMPRLRIALP
jgi:hypothetical protein